jgi:hypothetical protein
MKNPEIHDKGELGDKVAIVSTGLLKVRPGKSE